MPETADQAGGDAGRPLALVCSGVARVLSERLGRGPTKCRASWCGRDAIVVLLQDGYPIAEETLRVAGHGEAVRDARLLMLGAVEDELSRLVAEATGRHVEAVLSATRLQPDVSAEIFLLEPPEHAGRPA